MKPLGQPTARAAHIMTSITKRHCFGELLLRSAFFSRHVSTRNWVVSFSTLLFSFFFHFFLFPHFLPRHATGWFLFPIFFHVSSFFIFFYFFFFSLLTPHAYCQQFVALLDLSHQAVQLLSGSCRCCSSKKAGGNTKQKL